MTKEDFQTLSGLEFHLGTALNSNYCRIDARKALETLAAIYERTFNKPTKILKGCNRCVLSDIKEIARAYFDEKAKNKPIETIDENCGTTATKSTKKTTAAKKTAKNKKK